MIPTAYEDDLRLVHLPAGQRKEIMRMARYAREGRERERKRAEYEEYEARRRQQWRDACVPFYLAGEPEQAPPWSTYAPRWVTHDMYL